MGAPLISLSGVAKTYPLSGSGREKFATFLSLLRGRTPSHGFEALKDISFDVLKGQSLGLVGVNGAGKSTLLKIIAGVVKPTRGQVLTRGTVGALLELGAGFHPEYSGRENIFLACALMGMNKRQVEERIERIIEFADIGVYIDQPIKHYSSGMVVRLGFAVATTMEPDVLITDEVLAVGDESFQKKCVNWIERYLANGGTLLLCSHGMYHIQKLCRQAVWIDQGQLRMHAAAPDVCREYLAWHESKLRARKQEHHAEAEARAAQAGQYTVHTWTLNDRIDTAAPTLRMGDTLTVAGVLRSPDDRPPVVAVGLVRADGTPVYGVFSDADQFTLMRTEPGHFGFRLQFPQLPLLPGRYHVRIGAMDPEGMRMCDEVEPSFDIVGSTREMGFCRLHHQWR